MFDDENFELDDLEGLLDEEDLDEDFEDLDEIFAEGGDEPLDYDLEADVPSIPVEDSFEVPADEFKKFDAQPSFTSRLFAPRRK